MKSSGSPEALPPLWVVVPTYWGNSGEGIYDHPTPLDGESTLPRLVDSLLEQDYPDKFDILILLSTTSPALEGEAAVCLRKLLAPYVGKLNLLLADATAARHVSGTLNAHSLDLGVASMRGYAAVRNMQLLVPMALGAEVIAAVDDDEVLPPNYLSQAVKRIGKEQDGVHITGVGGPYLDESGNAFMAEADEVRNILVDKSVFMNAALRQVMGEEIISSNPQISKNQEDDVIASAAEQSVGISLSGRAISASANGILAMTDTLLETQMAFGGNMVFHRDLFTQVGFDPAITRGEDIDYLINARIAGQVFHFDPHLTITHLPPRHFEAPQYAKMRQDVMRFVYEREKIRRFDLPADDFKPYPGELLGDDFDRAALDALHACATPELTAQFGTPVEVLREAHAHGRQAVLEYGKFSTQWKKAGDILKKGVETEELLSLIRL